jgi:hypothetical protein
MAPPSEPQIDTEELMARVRATLGSSDAANDAGTATPIVLSPHFHQEQLLLDQAQRVVGVGATVPPFGGLSRLLRPFAKLTTRALYFLLQVITVDQRVFNGLLLNVARMTSAGLAQGEAALNERLNQLKAVLAGRERRIEALEGAFADLAPRSPNANAAWRRWKKRTLRSAGSWKTPARRSNEGWKIPARRSNKNRKTPARRSNRGWRTLAPPSPRGTPRRRKGSPGRTGSSPSRVPASRPSRRAPGSPSVRCGRPSNDRTRGSNAATARLPTWAGKWPRPKRASLLRSAAWCG